MSEIKLKPCPFCGGEARIVGAIGSVFWVRCTKCGAETQNELSQQQAAEAWKPSHREDIVHLWKLSVLSMGPGLKMNIYKMN